MAVSNIVKRLQNIMRNDAGINGDAQRIEQMTWLFFLKVYDAQEEEWELKQDNFKSIIPEELRWRNWAASANSNDSLTGDALLDFVNNKLSYTNLSVYRDLHCWEMRFNWIPIGSYKSWNFTINVKAQALKDLKYEKKKDYRDN